MILKDTNYCYPTVHVHVHDDCDNVYITCLFCSCPWTICHPCYCYYWDIINDTNRFILVYFPCLFHPRIINSCTKCVICVYYYSCRFNVVINNCLTHFTMYTIMFIIKGNRFTIQCITGAYHMLFSCTCIE